MICLFVVKYVNAALRFQSGMTTYQVRVETSALAPVSLLAGKAGGETVDNQITPSPMEEVEPEGAENGLTKTKPASPIPACHPGHGGVIPITEIRNLPIGPLNSNTVNPEEKRRIIGDVFIRVAEETWAELKLNPEEFLLCQGRPHALSQDFCSLLSTPCFTPSLHLSKPFTGTLRPDLIESASQSVTSRAEVIKTHHNVTDMVKRLAAQPHALLNKINAALSPEEQQRLADVTNGDNLVAHLLPIRTVGVQGDCRSYNYACVLSSNADSPDWDALFFMAQTIPRICHNINRVVYAFGQKIQHPVNDVTVTFLREPVIATLREVDARVNAVLHESGMMKKISQMPVILIPIHFDRDPAQMMAASSILRSVVLRPFVTSDFMTGLAAKPGVDLPLDVVQKMQDEASKVPGISRVLYDMTSKPPATTEWE
ncbi:unnamed protein product [Dibothriocephalus latus]|uniref:GMP synthase C-terminal domain-containing protein n=1 Tax=Dibothriocephalus latus TaxID=60516 RepID=A0A3P7NJZ3_DIBLA|nr:unnamed protein product [Dibothriocephalus latus]